MFNKHDTKRNSFAGEYDALQKYVSNRNNTKYPITNTLTKEEFATVAGQVCKLCGGKTPGYMCNTVNYLDYRQGYCVENIYAICWPCIKVVGRGNAVKTKVDQIAKITEHLQTHELDM